MSDFTPHFWFSTGANVIIPGGIKQLVWSVLSGAATIGLSGATPVLYPASSVTYQMGAVDSKVLFAQGQLMTISGSSGSYVCGFYIN